VQRDEQAAAEARERLAANEDSTQMTPERIAALEAQAAEQDAAAGALLDSMLETEPLAAAAPAGSTATGANGATSGSGAGNGSGRGGNGAKAPLDESASPVAGRRFKRG
jgi:hypothetical protein